MATPAQVRTCLWFDGNGHEAARFYVGLIPGSAIEAERRMGTDGPPLVVDFHLAGAPYTALNGGPHYTLTPAASIAVLTRDQAETDRLWDALTADGGQESRCGWLVDRFGVSWQLVPEALERLLYHEDTEAAARTFDAMLRMNRLDIAALEAAFHGASA